MIESEYDTQDQDLLVARATDEFLEQVHAGEQPDVETFARKYPTIKHILLNLLPAIQVSSKTEKPTTSNLRGGILGDFRIIRELGRGGMGIVYEAQQISLGRRVALKTLPFASAIDPIRLNRFKNEAQAAAQLHHRNILPVYAVGSERGVWYYAMQIVDGRSLADAIHEFRVGDQSEALSRICPNPETVTLSANERTQDIPGSQDTAALTKTDCEVEGRFQRIAVGMCLQAAQALEHAHSMDIVHRDVKPANLMIDNSGHLWVTDFGLARVRNDAAVTRTGDVIGTLAYMSPEQAMGDRAVVDHRSDIYSLGATLYELLTLRRPFEEENKAALVHKITTEVPASPRSLNSTIPIDLDTIVMKCLASDPNHRYLNAAELADDLTAFLADKPIKARRPSVGERISRWARRHRPLVAIAIVASLCLTLGLAAATAMIAREQARTASALKDVSQRERALLVALGSQERQRRKAEANLQRAEQNFLQSTEVLDSFIRTVEYEVQPEDLESLRRDLLEKSLTYYQDFIAQAQNNRPLQAQLARSHRRVASILFEIGTTEEAQAALERALQVQEQLVRENPRDPGLRGSLQAMYERLGTNDENRLVRLLAENSVRRELRLTRRQVARAERVVRDYFEFDEQVDRQNPTAIRQHVSQRVDKAVAFIAPLLEPDQFERLEQIELQLRGLDVWFDPEFSALVGLTADQKNYIRGLVSSSNREVRDAYHERRPGDVENITADYSAAVLRELDEGQRMRHSKLLGDPFEGRVRMGDLPGRPRKPARRWNQRPPRQ